MTPLYVKDRRDLEHQVVTMHVEGWSIRSLAKHFGLGRNTVRRIQNGPPAPFWVWAGIISNDP